MIQTILLSIFAADVIYKYISIDTSNPTNINSLFNDMTTFIETQRLREDMVREKCYRNIDTQDGDQADGAGLRTRDQGAQEVDQRPD